MLSILLGPQKFLDESEEPIILQHLMGDHAQYLLGVERKFQKHYRLTQIVLSRGFLIHLLLMLNIIQHSSHKEPSYFSSFHFKLIIFNE
jgi:hypothetical protein